MNFDEKVIQKGTLLYQGLRHGKGVPCRGIAFAKHFYISNEKNVANKYAKDYLCLYEAKKNLRLFVLNHNNILKIQQGELLNKLKFITGARMTIREQLNYHNTTLTSSSVYPTMKYFLAPMREKIATLKLNYNLPGQRYSFASLDQRVSRDFCREFLSPNGYDGYYAPSQKSAYHGNGNFHSEIMLCNASNQLLRISETNVKRKTTINLNRTPLFTKKEVEFVPKIFKRFLVQRGVPFTRSNNKKTFSLNNKTMVKNFGNYFKKYYTFKLNIKQKPNKSIYFTANNSKPVKLVN